MVAFGAWLGLSVFLQDGAAGQAAVPLSRPGQEDLSFWINHNGLVQFDIEGEVGFGDMARILLRRRSNGDYIRDLRDRFTFRVQDPSALATPDLYRAEFTGGTLTWRAAPQTRFIAGSSRTFNIPLLLVNRDAAEITVDATYQGNSMQSAVRKIVVPAQSSQAVFLRAVETRPGPSSGKLTVRRADSEITTPLYFDIRHLVPVRVKILNENGRPGAARMYITGSDGLAYAPRGSSSRIAAMQAEYFFHAEDSFEIEMPAGETMIEAARGQEYRMASQKLTLEPNRPAEATLRMTRWTDQAQKGFWSADVHIHANYTSPHHQNIEPRDVRLQLLAEDLNYGNMMVANSGGAFIHDRQYFEGKPHRLSSERCFIYWNEENRSSAYGHMCFLGLKKLVEPFYNGFRDTPHWEDYPANFPLAQAVFDQNGAVSYAHPGMSPSFEAASIKELPVDLALGQQTAMDVLSNNDEKATMEMWYRLLNCGFRVAISAGTDAFTNVVDHYVAGGGRIYVQTGPKFDYADWLQGYRQGRSFASNGPVVTLEVNGKSPGDEVRLDSSGDVNVHATVMTQTPLEQIELIINGKPVVSEPADGKTTIHFSTQIPLRESSWIAFRALGPRHRLVMNDTQAFAHTSPVYVTIQGRPVRIADDIRFYREWVERLIARTEKSPRFATEERRREVISLFRKGLDWYTSQEKLLTGSEPRGKTTSVER